MYITINNKVGKKRIDLAYLIWGKEVATVSMFSDNIQYQIKEPVKVLLDTNEEKELLKGVYTNRGRNASIGRKLKSLLDFHDYVIKTNKLADVTEMIISVDKLDNTNNLEDGRLSNVLLRCHVSDSKESTCFEPVTPQYKKLKNGEFSSLMLRITDQKNNIIPKVTVVLHIRD